MAKKTKTAPVETPSDETPTVAAPKAERGSNDIFQRVFVDGNPAPAVAADGTAKRVAPQLQAIADVLAVFGENGATRKDLVTALDGKLTTKQPIGRILSYYQKDLVNFGLATRTAEHIEAPTPTV